MYIRDYDFEWKRFCHYVGAPLEFRLSDEVPMHAEHILTGFCRTEPRMRFESPLLQVRSSLSASCVGHVGV